MLKKERQNIIMQMLEERQTMTVAELSDRTSCSTMTIRRDLDEMDRNALLKKEHGGASIIKSEISQPSFNRRISENTEEKNHIARAAVSMIQPESAVFFDAGSTSYCVARHVPVNLSFTAITNCLMTATELCNKPNVNVIMLGGEMHHSSYSSVNNIALTQASAYNTNLALISTKAFYYPVGLFESELPLIEIKRAFVRSSEKVVLLLDYSKFENKSLCMSIPFEDIDEIITDDKVSMDIVRQIEKSGKKITIV